MQALGLVETKGFLAAVEGADAMLKAADVRLLEKNLASGGLVTITVAGEVSAVQASVEAAKASILRIPGAELISTHVIPRPDEELAGILHLEPNAERPPQPPLPGAPKSAPSKAFVSKNTQQSSAAAKGESAGSSKAESRLKRMSLSRLRQMAWNTEGISMSEEAVAAADKKSLIAAILKASWK